MWGIVDQKEESVDKVQGTNGKCVEMDGCVHVCVHMLKSTQYLPLILYICVHEFRAQNRQFQAEKATTFIEGKKSERDDYYQSAGQSPFALPKTGITDR